MTIDKNIFGSTKSNTHYSGNLSSYFPGPSVYFLDINLNNRKKNTNANFISPGSASNTPSKTLEQILSPLLANSSNDPVDQIWEDKLKIARFKISSLVGALYLREKIKKQNIYGIDEDICKIHTQQFALATSPSFDKYSINLDQIGLEKTVCSLEHEKRSEVVSFWKDVTSLRKDLVEAIDEYLSLKRKMELLEIKAERYSND